MAGDQGVGNWGIVTGVETTHWSPPVGALWVRLRALSEGSEGAKTWGDFHHLRVKFGWINVKT